MNWDIKPKGGTIKMIRGKPKRDGSGRGTRDNRGRGGCKDTKRIGQGRGW